MNETATAHRAWNNLWQTAEGRADWLTPEADVLDGAKLARDRGGRRALDLGCGVGRHALAFASLGFETAALDGSEAGIRELRAQATAAGLTVETGVGFMTDLPYADATFDYVLSFNVIYHGDGEIVRRAIAEIRRVLKPGGIYQCTMLSKRNVNYGEGTEIAPDTFVRDGDGDKDHPHFYCNAAELVALFADFELLSLSDREHSKSGSWHWHLLAEHKQFR